MLNTKQVKQFEKTGIIRIKQFFKKKDGWFERFVNLNDPKKAEFKDEKINVLPPTEPSKSKTKARVNIEIVTSSNVYPGRYSMYLDEDGNWKIINIEINGMNLGKIFRNQFYSLMEKNNEDIDVVIEKWVASV